MNDIYQTVQSSKQKFYILISLSAIILFIGLGIFVYINFIPKSKPFYGRLRKTYFPPKKSDPISLSPSQIPLPSSSSIKEPDNSNTLNSPQKILTSEGTHYIFYGEPTGQNNKTLKKIIFSLPGHGSTAEQDYSAWKSQLLENGTYALASLGWWDGNGQNPTDYMSPYEVRGEIEYFLRTHGYTGSDFVLLEGFSRGSANTYAVVANDVASKQRVIDGVISASGKYQSNFAMTPELLNQNNGQLFASIPWILACGEKDPNPTLDGCNGMLETKSFLESKGAKVLALLKDPNGTHGAFHQSPLKLAVQALALFDANIK